MSPHMCLTTRVLQLVLLSQGCIVRQWFFCGLILNDRGELVRIGPSSRRLSDPGDYYCYRTFVENSVPRYLAVVSWLSDLRVSLVQSLPITKRDN